MRGRREGGPSSSNGTWRQHALPPANAQTSESHPIRVSWVVGDPAHEQGGRLGLCFCPGKRAAQGRGAAQRPIHRSLHADLQRLRQHFGVSTVVCLLNDAELAVRRRHTQRKQTVVSAVCEMRAAPSFPPAADRQQSLGLRDVYRSGVAKAQLELLQFPIVEMAPPEDLMAAASVVEDIVSRLATGQAVAMHCRCGRMTGTDGWWGHQQPTWGNRCPLFSPPPDGRRGGVGRAGLMAACVLLRLGEATSAQHAIRLVSNSSQQLPLSAR